VSSTDDVDQPESERLGIRVHEPVVHEDNESTVLCSKVQVVSPRASAAELQVLRMVQTDAHLNSPIYIARAVKLSFDAGIPPPDKCSLRAYYEESDLRASLVTEVRMAVTCLAMMLVCTVCG
jgi:hypothetical protein